MSASFRSGATRICSCSNLVPMTSCSFSNLKDALKSGGSGVAAIEDLSGRLLVTAARPLKLTGNSMVPYTTLHKSVMSTSDKRRVTKTTVYLDAGDYQRLKGIARAEGRTAAELVREAVAEYAQRHSHHPLPRSLGAGRSGRGDLSERAEELLNGLGQDE